MQISSEGSFHCEGHILLQIYPKYKSSDIDKRLSFNKIAMN